MSSPAASNKRKRPSPAPIEASSQAHPPHSTSAPLKSTAVSNTNAAPPLPDEPLPPPLPNEALPPPLPNEPIPGVSANQHTTADPPSDDGWAPVWDATAQAYYFYNRFTQKTQWENPRVPEATAVLTNHDRIDTGPPGAAAIQQTGPPPTRAAAGGYNPAIHGDYDPNADYAQLDKPDDEIQQPVLFNPDGTPVVPSTDPYAATAQFNRFTGRFQAGDLRPENYNDESKSKRQMNAFFDVDAAANVHDGRSLRKERQERKLTKEEVKAFREKAKAKKEQKRRAWLRD